MKCFRVARQFDLFFVTNSSMEDSYLKSPEAVCAHFKVNPLKGLSSQQVTEQRKIYGSNGKCWWQILHICQRSYG